VFEVGVDAAVGDEADEVEAPARSGGDGFLENFIAGERAVADGKVDAGEFLIDDATGAEVEVANLGISHLSFGEADLKTAGLESAPGVISVKAIVDGGFGEKGGVALFFGTGAAGGVDAPTVANQKKNRLGHPARIMERREKSRVELSQHLASGRMAKSWGLRFLRKKRRIVG
jgi:hypothetical protein